MITRALLGALGALALVLATPALAAEAATGAAARAASATSTASWSVTLGAVGSPATVDLPLAAGPRYLTATNAGTASLASGYEVVYDLRPTALISVGRVEVRACSTAWDETAGTCSGTTTVVASTVAAPTAVGAGALAAAVPVDVASTRRLQVVGVQLAVGARVEVSARVTN